MEHRTRVHVAARMAMAVAAAWFLIGGGPALADPPYGEGFDAPAGPDHGVRIDPGQYFGYFSSWLCCQPDVDTYEFVVVSGQDLRVSCTQTSWFDGTWRYPNVPYPCNATLLDPAGTPQPAKVTADAIRWSVPDASAGIWRLQVSGADVWASGMAGKVPYILELALFSPQVPSSAGSGGGGAIGFGTLLIGTVAALLGVFRRAARRSH